MMRFSTAKLLFCALTLFAFTACEKDNAGVETVEMPQAEPQFMDLSELTSKKSFGKSAEGHNIVLYKAEYYTVTDGEEMGNTIFFSDRSNKQLFPEWEAGAQLIDGTTDVTYYVDQNRPSADAGVDLPGVLGNVFATWEGVECSELNLTEIPYDGRPAGVVAAIFGYPGGSFQTIADIVQAGFLPAAFFDRLRPGGGNGILGVTFTFTYEDAFGIPIDSDGDGKPATAITEIYYNDGFNWTPGVGIDFETVALHETGHSLGQAHFGKVFRTQSNGKVHFSPRAVMNAGYSGVNRDINATDNAGHCSNWGNWPNN